MTYDKISQFRIGKACKYSNVDVGEVLNNRRSCIGDYTEIWSFQEASIPVYSRGSERKTQIANSRTKGGIYCQDSQRSSFSCQTICKIYWGIIKQYCYTSAKIIFKEKWIWLRRLARGRLRWFIVLIGWLSGRFCKYIDY